MKIIAVSNQKGGIGKTTTATNLAYGLSLRDKRVLLVDCDPQCNSSKTFGADLSDGSPTLADLLFTNDPAKECVQHTQYGDILASDRVLDEAETRLKGFARFFRLKNRLNELAADYDYCVLDTPPALNLLLQNALIAANGVIVPILSDSFSVDGLNDFYQTVVDIKSQPNPDLEVLGLLLVRFDKRSVLNKEAAYALPSVAGMLNTVAFDTKIRHTVAVPESQVARMPIFEYNKKCTAARDYDEFINELERRRML